MVVEDPGNAETLANDGGESLDSELFGSVVAGVDHVDAPLVGIEVSVVSTLAGNECVATFGNRVGNHVTGAAGDDTNAATCGRSAGEKLGVGAQFFVQPRNQIVTVQRQLASHAEGDSLIGTKRSVHCQAKPVGQPHELFGRSDGLLDVIQKISRAECGPDVFPKNP